jgi:hypothetical protein
MLIMGEARRRRGPIVQGWIGIRERATFRLQLQSHADGVGGDLGPHVLGGVGAGHENVQIIQAVSGPQVPVTCTKVGFTAFVIWD